MNKKKSKSSALRVIELKRKAQKKSSVKRWILSFLGLLFVTTILGGAFFLGLDSEEVHQKQHLSGLNKHDKKEKKIDSKSYKITQVMEESPQDSPDHLGFGLEDLIRKTRENALSDPSLSSRSQKKQQPELVLIIDDISNTRQLKKVQTLPYHITPSIFPPSQMNAHSNLLAKGLQHYMIHLPMQSASRKMNSFEKTMMIRDSQEKITNRIRQIRKLFPTAKFVNNHTGSIFTSNYSAMRKAYIELKRNGFIFLDSRTSGKSVVKKITSIYGDPYLSRDIFIDNVQNQKAILAQLRRAVILAKRRGYAIAIGHPHSVTFDALRHARALLSEVRTLYLDDFYRKHYANP